MDYSGKANPDNESSLLLKYPINLFSSNSSSENLLMPVGVSETNATTSCPEVIASSISTNTVEPRQSSTICQLEQPLLFGGVSKSNNTSYPNVSHDPSVAESTVSYFSQPLEQSTQENITPYSQPSSQITTEIYSLQSNTSSRSTTSFLSESNYVTAPLESMAYSSTSLPLSSELQSGSTIQTPHSNYSIKDDALDVDSTGLFYPVRNFEPVQPYWFYKDIVESKEIWYRFSETDSQNLEKVFQSGSDSIVPTDGGRCDVYLERRIKKFIYFEGKELQVRRCTWFHQQGSAMKFAPYDESSAACLEDYYHKWIISDSQDRRFVIPGIIGSFLFEKPSVMLHYGVDINTWTASNDHKGNPKIVKRGLPEGFQIMPDESSKIDNLLFIVQGIGSFCDLRFRTVAECVDGFRDIANKLIWSHFTKEVQQGLVGRVEILPVAWHAKLRTTDIALDRTMKTITLPSIPRLRHFTNDTLIDILLYSSPSFCQSIIDTVAQEINCLYKVFISRNPNFSGKVFVAGHSLGSLILFDILSNQNITDYDSENSKSECKEHFETDLPGQESLTDIEQLLKSLDLEEYLEVFGNEKIDLETLPFISDEDLKNLGLPTGHRRKLMNAGYFKEKLCFKDLTAKESSPDSENKIVEVNDCAKNVSDCHNRMIFPLQQPDTGASSIIYPKLLFHPAAFFAMGSPISMFLAVRGFDAISENYCFPTCPAFFHIFHPYDPVAFRIEPLIDHSFKKMPALIPHHKGRKRMHLEIKENVTKFANELRQKVMDTLHKTWHSFNELTGLQQFPSVALEREVSSMVSQEFPEIATYDENTFQETPIGNLNGGRRIDYVLQEKPLEALNDYVWALTSHATYWDSEDTVLMILREIYAIQGINVPAHSESDSFKLESPSEIATSCQAYEAVPRPSGVSTPDSMPSNNLNNVYVTTSSNVLAPFENVIFAHTPSECAYRYAVPLSTPSQLPRPPPSQPLAPPPFQPHEPLSQSLAPPPSQSHEPLTQPLGPPPLTGFVKRSAFTK